LIKAIPSLAKWRESNRQEIAARRYIFKEAIAAAKGWSISACGGYFGFVQHPYPSHQSREVSAELMRQTGVLTIPGGFFGPDYEDHLRFAFANAEQAAIADLPERFQHFALS